MDRRIFLKATGLAVGSILLQGCIINRINNPLTNSVEKPNILWISAEDISPDLGCYGDRYAVTPNLDRLASEGTRFTNVFTTAGVCAPVRSGIITCMYPTSIGTNHMRCKGVPPAEVKCFTEYLRAAGYYCSNNSKTDYQFDSPATAWDECSGKAHWRNRPEGKPFFSVINLTITHESQIRNNNEKMLERIEKLSTDEKHDPVKGQLPPYYPDTDVVRKDWARYYDIITLMDKQAGEILRELEDDGLSENTIVWFWGDHGRGLPRAKRWIYDSGIHIPLIIRVPEKYRTKAYMINLPAVEAGTVNEDMVSSIDFGATVLSLAGVKIPKYMHGKAFLGGQKCKARGYIYAARDRMDEAIDCIRAVRDKQFKYIRNFMPHLSYGQDIEYMNEMPTMQEMRRLNAEGKLKGPQRHYFLETKPPEELYDITADPHETKNLAGNPYYKDVVKKMKRRLYDWMVEVGDTGLIPEPDFDSIKRPDDKYEQTSAPGIMVLSKSKDDEPCSVKLICDTKGASMAYQINGEDNSTWQLYTNALTLRRGEKLKVKACRLGFKDSKVVEFKCGDKPMAMETAAPQKHWGKNISKTLVRRLLKVKEMDCKLDKHLSEYLNLLDNKDSTVRYWAVLGLGRSGINHLSALLEDSSDSVRVAAAEILCHNKITEEKGLNVLQDILKNGSNSGRLYAVTSLGRICQNSENARTLLRESLNDKDGYVQRVSRNTLKRLGEEIIFKD